MEAGKERTFEIGDRKYATKEGTNEVAVPKPPEALYVRQNGEIKVTYLRKEK